jgi:hypothetical protein
MLSIVLIVIAVGMLFGVKVHWQMLDIEKQREEERKWEETKGKIKTRGDYLNQAGRRFRK